MYDWIGKNFSVKIIYSKGSVATQILVKLNRLDDYFLLDCGDGTLRDLINLNIALSKISAIMISHEHYDHIGGIYSLLGYFYFKKRTENLNIYVPDHAKSFKKIIDLINDNYQYKNLYTVNLNLLHSGNIARFKDVNIEIFPAFHPCGIKDVDPVNKSGFIYKFTAGLESIVYTGDTGYKKHLENIIKDNDLAIIEATYKTKAPEEQEWHLEENTAKSLGKLAKNHLLIHKR